MAIPVIVTLFQDKIDFIDKVPIVPIFQFSSFIDEFYGNMDQMKNYRNRLVMNNPRHPNYKHFGNF